MLPWASNVCRLAFFLSVYEEEEDIYIYIQSLFAKKLSPRAEKVAQE